MFPEWTYFDLAILFLFVYGTLLVPLLLFVPAPFGKFSRSGWGFDIDGKLGWFVMEFVACVAVPWFFFDNTDTRTDSAASYILLTLWLVHYIHRSCYYTYIAPSMNKTNPAVVLSAVQFNLCNGFINGFALSETNESRLVSPCFWIGIVIFLMGMAANIASDRILFSLRMQRDVVNKGQAKRYFIPRGFLFEYVSGANYFGEIVEWIGWAIACGNNAGVAFAFFTAANLVPRAITTHQWYLTTFQGAYPKSRKAVVPYLL
ncbi:3-oxo-5-alpha-steroid 4-dehydrogenase-domain-containing protein [Chytriomyces sp. MP71]|nr:3-oxo-5-alpha-steroid 4-dehydrogenase-domain-containing protein [Chytriomyces sp. MP71]